MSKHVSKHYKRVWLNPKHGRAFVIGKAVVSEDGYVHANLTIGDCGQDICLDFDADDEAGVRKRLFKIDALRAQLDVIEAALLDGAVRQPTKKEWKEIRKAQKEHGYERHFNYVDIGD